MKNDPLTQRFSALIDFIDEAIEHAENGKSVDLGNLNREVDRLCDDAKKADPSLLPRIKVLMSELISKLDDLSLHLADVKKKFTNGH